MEVKNWTYEEYPAFTEPVDGVVRIATSGDDCGCKRYCFFLWSVKRNDRRWHAKHNKPSSAGKSGGKGDGRHQFTRASGAVP